MMSFPPPSSSLTAVAGREAGIYKISLEEDPPWLATEHRPEDHRPVSIVDWSIEAGLDSDTSGASTEQTPNFKNPFATFERTKVRSLFFCSALNDVLGTTQTPLSRNLSPGLQYQYTYRFPQTKLEGDGCNVLRLVCMYSNVREIARSERAHHTGRSQNALW